MTTSRRHSCHDIDTAQLRPVSWNPSFIACSQEHVALYYSRQLCMLTAQSQIWSNIPKHTKSSRKLYNSQIKLYEITRTVEHKNKSAHTEMSRANLDFRLIVNSTRHATEGTYTNINNNI